VWQRLLDVLGWANPRFEPSAQGPVLFADGGEGVVKPLQPLEFVDFAQNLVVFLAAGPQLSLHGEQRLVLTAGDSDQVGEVGQRLLLLAPGLGGPDTPPAPPRPRPARPPTGLA